VTTAVWVGRLTVRAARSGLGQDVVARLRAEALVAALDLDPRGRADRSVLVLRRVRWQAGRQLPAMARAAVVELSRSAARPARSPAPGSADAVLFADEAELLACLTRDALAGQLTRWYWRQLAPTGLLRIGAVLAAAWTARARWLPAALAALPATEAVRAVSTLTPSEAAGVRRAMLTEFADSGTPLPGPDGPSTALPGPAPATGNEPAAAGGEPPATGGATAAGPPAPWLRWLRPSQPLQPEQEALLGMAIALHAQPALARRPAFAVQAGAWLRHAAHPAAVRTATDAAAPAGDYGASRAVATSVIVTGSVVASAGPADAMAPALGDARAEPIQVRQAPAPPDKAAAGSAPDAPAESAPVVPAAAWAGGVPSQLASVLYLVNVLGWLDLTAGWPVGTGPGGWAVLELLARHLLTETAPRDDPLWTLLAELDGRAPGTIAEAGIGTDDPVRLPAAWLRRWTPWPARWEWAVGQGRMMLADRRRGFVVADVPCPSGQGVAAAAAEHARLRNAGVSGSLHQGLPLEAPGSAAPGDTPGWIRWRATVGQFVTWLLDSRDVQAGALAQPGRVAVTRTHVDVVLDLDHVDMAARVCGLDRDPGWVPDLGRIVAFHFEAGG
jgi:hypothetical protein